MTTVNAAPTTPVGTYEILYAWVFHTPEGEMLETIVVQYTHSGQLHLRLIAADGEQVSVTIDIGLPAPHIDAMGRALEALKQLRAPPPSRLSRSSTGGRRRIIGGGS